MSEISRKVVPYEYNYLCEACMGGVMQVMGEAVDGQYPHQCYICGDEVMLSKAYPHVEYFGEGEVPAHITTELPTK